MFAAVGGFCVVVANNNPSQPILGATVLAGAGYYFYKAGGDPKVAQKKLEGTWTYNASISYSSC